MITKYAILDETYEEGDEVITNTLENNTLTGSLEFQQDIDNYQFTPFTIRIYFEWYEGQDEKMNDQQDAEIGHQAAAENTTLQIAASIKFEQQIKNIENL